MDLTEEQLLAEVEDILRTVPPRESLRHPTDENFAWLGRVKALIEAWKLPKAIYLNPAINQLLGRDANAAQEGFCQIMTLLHEARHNLRMKTVGPLSAAIGKGSVFDYFDEIRKIVEPAAKDVLFVDPYLDAEFVARYLPHIRVGVAVRLLARERLATLLPATDAFSRQSGTAIGVRSSPGFHDRHVFIDGAACYQSGASFKDGAKASPTTLTQITDALPVVLKIYEDLWISGKVER